MRRFDKLPWVSLDILGWTWPRRGCFGRVLLDDEGASVRDDDCGPAWPRNRDGKWKAIAQGQV